MQEQSRKKQILRLLVISCDCEDLEQCGLHPFSKYCIRWRRFDPDLGCLCINRWEGGQR